LFAGVKKDHAAIENQISRGATAKTGVQCGRAHLGIAPGARLCSAHTAALLSAILAGSVKMRPKACQSRIEELGDSLALGCWSLELFQLGLFSANGHISRHSIGRKNRITEPSTKSETCKSFY
jgi:hypothetical protein